MALPALTLPVLTSGLLTEIYREKNQREWFAAENGGDDNAE
jgi:hypothetical protein